MLTFVIPTHNRPEHLKRCLESIVSQIEPGMDVGVTVVDDTVDQPIDKILEEFPSVVRHARSGPHRDYSDAFRDMMRAAGSSEWVWTFGDDDLLRPGALKFMVERLLSTPAELSFIHIAEEKRASGANSVYTASSLLDLCNTFGWLEMTGFITGNITRGASLEYVAGTPRWNIYAKSAYVQSCALLEGLCNSPAAFLDLPLITSQEKEQTEETAKNWQAQGIAERYLLVVDALEAMYENNILTKKLPVNFFRYLVYHLWDRFLSFYLADYFNHQQMWGPDEWGRLAKFPTFLADEEFAKQLATDIEAARGLVTLGVYLGKNITGINGELQQIFERRNKEFYPYSFVGATAPANASQAQSAT